MDHWRRQDNRAGLVPTMGALHDGHFALVRRSLAECEFTAVTIFVNPTQFGPNEDLDRYPRTLDADLAGLRDLGVDLVFVPRTEDLYPSGYSTYVDPPDSAAMLEGEFRSDHFRGVVTIVLKLFHLCPATVAYFGEKDFQQLTVIRHMVEDLNVPIRITGCPTVREADGLAMSSRNRYLNEQERHRALGLWGALQAVHQLYAEGVTAVEDLEAEMHRKLEQSGVDAVDYAKVVDLETLQSLQQLDGPAIALIAARVGKTRLIDNLKLEN